MEFIYQKLQPHQTEYLYAIIELYTNVFEMKNSNKPTKEYLDRLLLDERIIFVVAIVEGEVVGALTAYVLPAVYAACNEVYLYDLAVITSLHRQGIGTHLLHELKAYCQRMKYKEVFVQADAEDVHAIDFYKATGGHPLNAVHFSYPL